MVGYAAESMRGNRAFVALASVAVLLISIGPMTRAEPAGSLMLATWNVCKIDCDAPAPSWGVRRTRMARVVSESQADVLSVNEATNWAYRSGTQWDDVQRLLAPLGLASPEIEDDRCEQAGCTHTSRLLFRPATVQQAVFTDLPSAGYARVVDIAPGVSTDADRQVAWAYLQGVPGSGIGVFLVMSVHLSTLKTSKGEQHRVMFGRAVQQWTTQMNDARGLPGAPTIVMGDFNSTESRNPRGVQFVMTQAGWTDAISAPARKNIRINSINYTPTQRSGWPIRPIYNKWTRASRIDYIMMRGPVQPLTYEVVVHTIPGGRFDPAYQASDHLMVRARLHFG